MTDSIEPSKKKKQFTAYVGLGSNISPEEHLIKCSHMLRNEWGNSMFSYTYKTAALDETNQDDFLNAVIRIETADDHDHICSTIQAIESALQKNPPYPKGPRTIDLDFLLFENQPREYGDYIIPHPRMHERRFVLEPLCDLIEIEAKHPVLEERYFALLQNTNDQHCEHVGLIL